LFSILTSFPFSGFLFFLFFLCGKTFLLLNFSRYGNSQNQEPESFTAEKDEEDESENKKKSILNTSFPFSGFLFFLFFLCGKKFLFLSIAVSSVSVARLGTRFPL
jgi:hypothetical protein